MLSALSIGKNGQGGCQVLLLISSSEIYQLGIFYDATIRKPKCSDLNTWGFTYIKSHSGRNYRAGIITHWYTKGFFHLSPLQASVCWPKSSEAAPLGFSFKSQTGKVVKEKERPPTDSLALHWPELGYMSPLSDGKLGEGHCW